MIQKEVTRNGLIDMSDRVIRELLRTPKFKAVLTIMLSAIDSQSAPSLVRTLFWQDPGVFLSIIGVIPSLLNTLIELLNEAGEQFNSLPKPLLVDFMEKIASPLDGEKLGMAAGNMSVLISKLRADDAVGLKEFASTLMTEIRKGYLEKLGQEHQKTLFTAVEMWIAALAAQARDEESFAGRMIRTTGEAIRKNPDFSAYVVQPLLKTISEGKA